MYKQDTKAQAFLRQFFIYPTSLERSMQKKKVAPAGLSLNRLEGDLRRLVAF
jgi:hypothetical protein